MAAFDDMSAPARKPVTQLAGAACSLALMVGIGAWGTTMVIRDVSGVPVVRAVQGEMRRAPDHAGGRIADHEGLSVNEIAARGEAGGPEDMLLLAPSGSDLAAEDLEVAPLGEDELTVTELVEDDGTEVAEAPQDEAASEALQTVSVTSGPMSADEILAFADRIAEGADPLTDLAEGEDVAPVTMVDGEEIDPVAAALAEAMAMDAPPAIEGKLAQTLRPALRPRANPGIQPQSESMVVPVSLTTEDVPLPSAAVLTDALPVGTKLVQLGAFPTPTEAQAEWDRLSVRFADYMGDKTRVIQEASSGGATFYRLRASGFGDLADARRFCATLDAARAACIPVIVR
ncbi:SPOR domain-containing protein [Salipiger sp. IMCC34102]|uniref:SPOR domain-containing protein n=1 Tax=Salipiger sp. IMCC34102 TaxID=2510647 RepID=UPI001F5C3D56|nr:SPOR domain-containing protein [Salipiger sp. IMCC34102]